MFLGIKFIISLPLILIHWLEGVFRPKLESVLLFVASSNLTFFISNLRLEAVLSSS